MREGTPFSLWLHEEKRKDAATPGKDREDEREEGTFWEAVLRLFAPMELACAAACGHGREPTQVDPTTPPPGSKAASLGRSPSSVSSPFYHQDWGNESWLDRTPRPSLSGDAVDDTVVAGEGGTSEDGGGHGVGVGVGGKDSADRRDGGDGGGDGGGGGGSKTVALAAVPPTAVAMAE